MELDRVGNVPDRDWDDAGDAAGHNAGALAPERWICIGLCCD